MATPIPIVPESLYLEVIRYLLYVAGAITSLGVVEILRRLYNIEKKQDKQNSSLMLKQDFKDWKDKDFHEWKEGRDGQGGLWDSINHHSHEGIIGEGKVVKQ